MLDSIILRRAFEICVLLLGIWSFLTILFVYEGDYTLKNMIYFQLFGWSLTAFLVLTVSLSLGKKMLSLALLFLSYLLVFPFTAARKYPWISRIAENVTLFIVYLLVVFERYLRWILTFFVGYHKATGKPYSLVCAMDTDFSGFDFWGRRQLKRRKSEGDLIFTLRSRPATTTSTTSKITDSGGSHEVKTGVKAVVETGGGSTRSVTAGVVSGSEGETAGEGSSSSGEFIRRRNRNRSVNDLTAPDLFRRSLELRHQYYEREKRLARQERRKKKTRKESEKVRGKEEEVGKEEEEEEEEESTSETEEDEEKGQDYKKMKKIEEEGEGALDRTKRLLDLSDASGGESTDDEEEKREAFAAAKAISCALASKLAYESTPIIKHECRGWGFDRCDVVRYRNCKAYVASNARMVLVVFAGTQPMNIRHYVTDLSATLVPAPGPLGHVHAGFMAAIGIEVDIEKQRQEEKEQEEQEKKLLEVLGKVAEAKSLEKEIQKQRDKGKEKDEKEGDEKKKEVGMGEVPVLVGEEKDIRAMEKAQEKIAASIAKLDIVDEFIETRESWAQSLKTTALFAWQRIAKPVALWVLKIFRQIISLDEYYEKDLKAYSPDRPTTYNQILEIFDELKFLVTCRSHIEGVRTYKFRRREPGDKRKLWITGHSLGGALGTLFTAKLLADYPLISESELVGGIYTFGQPRLGDIQFASYLNRKVGHIFYRLVHDNDVVPRLPLGIPAWLVKRFLKHGSQSTNIGQLYKMRNNLLCFVAGVAADESTSYKHVGILKFIDSHGRVSDQIGLYKIIYLQLAGLADMKVIRNLNYESWMRIVLRIVLPFFLNDHLICDYVRVLQKNLLLPK